MEMNVDDVMVYDAKLPSDYVSKPIPAPAENGMRVYVNTCPEYRNNLYPISVTKDQSYTFAINPPAPYVGSRQQPTCFIPL